MAEEKTQNILGTPRQNPRAMVSGRPKITSRTRNESLAGYVLILPAVTLYAVFVVWPLLGTVRFSFFDWNGVSAAMDFVGINNYVDLFRDPYFWNTLKNNLFWVVLKLALTIVPALLLAVAIQNVRWGKSFFRTALFLPNILALAVVGIIWAQIYDPFIGIFGRGWLGGEGTALFALVFANSWQSYGFYMVLYLAGIQNIDISFYEAAAIDGATRFQQFYAITLPLLKGTTTLVVVLALINAMKAFDIIWTTTEGGPFSSTEVLATWTYRLAFARNEVGLGSALSVILGTILIAMTVIMMKFRDEEQV